MKPALFALLFLAASLACGSEPPGAWKTVLLGQERAKELWDYCCIDGRLYPTRLIGIYRTMGSQHDGDRQLDVALLLAQVPDDPQEALRHYLKSPDPYDRAFAVQVIWHLGDRRFLDALDALTKDTSSTKQWDILPYKTVGEAARMAADEIRRGKNNVQPPGGTVPKWLQAARAPEKIQK